MVVSSFGSWGPKKLLDAIGKVGNKIEIVRNYRRVY